MNVIEAKAEYLDTRDKTPYEFIERVARTCYKSEDKITSTSANKMIEMLAKNKHTAMLEHAHLYFVMDEVTLYDITARLNRQSISIKDKNCILPLENFFNITNTSNVHVLSGSFRSFITLCENNISEKHYTICKLREILNNKYPEVFPALSEESINNLKRTEDKDLIHKSNIDIYTRDEFIKYIKNTYDESIANNIFYKHLTHTLLMTCDRGISHEFVRHRPASFAMESTRYVNYFKDKFNNEITVIKPCFWDEDSEQYKIWYNACLYAEEAYFKIIKNGGFAQLARDVLPTSVKTELVITATEIEWQHIINLRYYGTTGMPHPQMIDVMQKAFPILQDNSNYRLK